MGSLTGAALGLVRLAKDLLGAVEGKWEAPSIDRRMWRKRKPDGSYEYRDTPPDQSPAKKTTEGRTITYANYIKLDRKNLHKVLSNGHFTIISAGRNGKDTREKDMEATDPFFHERHEKLRADLEANGLAYTEAIGHYDNPESSFIVIHDGTTLTPKTSKSVMVHHRDDADAKRQRRVLAELGEKYNQDSVLFGSEGKNDILFTTGERKGKKCGGKGWKETPAATNYYTDVELSNREHTKFALDIQECIDKGWV